MSNFNTIPATSSSTSTDNVLVRQGGVDYKQDRESFAAGISNSRWTNTADYLKGSEIFGSDGNAYLAQISNGASVSTPVNPVGDTTGTWKLRWKVIAENLHSIGDVVLRMDATDPSTLYGGTWNLVTGNATLTFGDGTSQTGTVIGSNVKTVPLPSHTHGASTNTTGSHSHSQNVYAGNDINFGLLPMGTDDQYGSATTGYINAAGNHSHTVTINHAGTSGASMDVQGATIAINVWVRVA